MGGRTPRKSITHAIGPALGLLALALLGAGQGPPSRPNPPGASAAIPPALPPDVTSPRPESNLPPSPGALAQVGSPLIPGQVVQPIDLANVLRLAGARDLDIATARQQVLQSIGDLDLARGLWLPSLFTGPTYYRLDGQVQAINGQVMTVDRGSLFLGTTASLANSFPLPPPGSGFPTGTALSGVLRFSDAIYGTLDSRRDIAANEAGVQVATNNALLAVSEAYFDLQLAAGTSRRHCTRGRRKNAEVLTGITETFARSGAGLEADHRRISTELRAGGGPSGLHAVGKSGNRLGQPGPPVGARPAHRGRTWPSRLETVIRLVADDVLLDDLICRSLRTDPSWARARELSPRRPYCSSGEAKLRLVCPVAWPLTYFGGGFGGGTGLVPRQLSALWATRR